MTFTAQRLPDDILQLVITQFLDASEEPERCAAILARISKSFLVPAPRSLYSTLVFTNSFEYCEAQRKSVVGRPHLAELVRNVIVELPLPATELRLREVFRACKFLESVTVSSEVAPEQGIQLLVEEDAGAHLTTVSLFHAPIDSTPPVEFQYTNLATLPHLARLSLSHHLLTRFPPACQSTLTYLSLHSCNAISFSPLIESSPLLTNLAIINSEFNGVPRALLTQHQTLRHLILDNSSDLDNLSTKISMQELSDFVGSFPALESVRLGIPYWDEAEEGDWDGTIPLPSTLRKIIFTGPTSPSSSHFIDGLAVDRWPLLKELKLGVGVGKDGEMQNCCSMSEDAIWNLERAVRERGGIYLSINEGRADVADSITVRNRKEEPLYCHSLICDPKRAESTFEPCILDDQRGSSD